MVINLRCAWCQKPLGQKNGGRAGNGKPVVSHSICLSCRQRFLDEIEAYKKIKNEFREKGE